MVYEGEKKNYVELGDFGIKREDVEWIDTEETLEKMVETISEKAEKEDMVIGLDCEFTASFIPGERTEVDLIQIATKKKIYLVDLIKLRSKKAFHAICELMSHHDIQKLGIGFKEDLKGILKRMGKEEIVG